MRWFASLLVTLIVVLIAVVPIINYRDNYTNYRRLRVVAPGKFYRSGQLTAKGFRDAIDRYGIKTILNVQNEFPDPMIRFDFFDSRSISESILCQQLGVNYRFIAPELLPRTQIPQYHPRAIDEFLQIMDDPELYPILIHCKAGLHRTGLLCAIYRIEYERWSIAEAVRELRAHGFGDSACTIANDYLVQYLSIYRPRWTDTDAQNTRNSYQ